MKKVEILLTKVIISVTAICLIVLGAVLSEPPIKTQAQNEVGAEGLLEDYSLSLEGNIQPNTSEFSPAMLDLIKDRQDFYAEYFVSALHSDLLGVESVYTLKTVNVDPMDKTLEVVGALETLTFTGKYRLNNPEDYPMVLAARLAIKNATDPRVKQELEDYAVRALNDITESLKPGRFEITWVLNHSIVYDQTTNTIIADTYSDVARDKLTGTDKIAWQDGSFVRQKPEIEPMADYMIFNTSVEDLAKGLLDQYNEIYAGHSQ